MANAPNLDVTLEALAHLLCSEREGLARDLSKAAHRHHAVNPGHFDGFEVFHPADDNADDDFILLGNNAADLPIWPVDVTHASLCSGEGWQEGTWMFSRLRTLDLKAWRGKLRLMSPRMIEEAMLISQPAGDYRTIVQPYALFGKEVRMATGSIAGMRADASGAVVGGIDPGWFGHRHGDDRESNARMQELVCLVAGLTLRRHYLWSVLLGEGGGPRARFVTDPIGVREAFRLRDIPPGAKRRAALLHWVRAHWRKSRSVSADDRSWVRSHLRGAWSYEWNGLRCQIEPSGEDMAMLTTRSESASGMKA